MIKGSKDNMSAIVILFSLKPNDLKEESNKNLNKNSSKTDLTNNLNLKKNGSTVFGKRV